MLCFPQCVCEVSLPRMAWRAPTPLGGWAVQPISEVSPVVSKRTSVKEIKREKRQKLINLECLFMQRALRFNRLLYPFLGKSRRWGAAPQYNSNVAGNGFDGFATDCSQVGLFVGHDSWFTILPDTTKPLHHAAVNSQFLQPFHFFEGSLFVKN